MLLHFFFFCLFEIGSSLVLRLIYKTLVFYLIFLDCCVFWKFSLCFSAVYVEWLRMETKRRNDETF